MSYKNAFLRFLTDDSGGERDTLTTLLILALIIIPLIIVIIAFGNDILEYAQGKWDEVIGSPVSG
ncbi:MAG: hypothetical protein GY856_32455 [bacterium]|nr:hypothetical protein [bacterium]